jgi:hypothetical protein
MRRSQLRAAAILATLSSVAISAAPNVRDWGSYGNNRFNFAACYPPWFRGQGEAGNGDGQRFRAKDGAQLAVFGSNEGSGAKLDNYLSDSIEELAGKGAKITYRQQKRNWLVASGNGPKGEFYIKRFLRQDQMLSFQLVYPTSLHAQYAQLVTAMVGCFTIGAEPGH